MNWIDIFTWIAVLTVVSNLFYKKGIKAGIRHALIKLRLDQEQVNILNEELRKDSHDLAKETIKEIVNETGLLWTSKLVGFGVSNIVFAFFTWTIMNEGMLNPKTLSCFVLSLAIISILTCLVAMFRPC